MVEPSLGPKDKNRYAVQAQEVRGLVQGDHNIVRIGLDSTSNLGPLNLAPPRLERVFGRSKTLESLRLAINTSDRSDRSPVLLRGRPGVGKTTVALELAYDQSVLERHPDGVLWISVGKNGQGVLPGLVDWGRALGVSATDIVGNSIDSWCRALHHATRHRAFFIVIDDVWRVHDALPFLIGGDECSRLITTRSATVCAEISAILPFELDDLKKKDANDLLVHSAGLSDSPLAIRLKALLEISGGLPLALVVAGSYLRRHLQGDDPDRINQALVRIRNRRLRLDLTRPENLFDYRDMPISLATMISLSVDDLGPAAMRALQILARLQSKPNTFSKAAATAICGVPESAIYELVDGGLLDVSNTMSRYSFHQSIVDFALELPREEHAERSIISYFVAEAERSRRDGIIMQSDFANHLTALDLAFEQGADNDYIRGVLALAPLMKDRVPYIDVERYLRRALRLVRKGGDEGAEARLLVHLAEMARVTEGGLSAEAYAREGLRISRTTERIPERIDLLLQLSAAQHASGGLEAAIRTSGEAYQLANDINDRERIAHAAFRIGGVTHQSGNEDEAYRLCHESFQIACDLSITSLQADVSYILGWVQFVRGEYEESLGSFERQRTLGHAAGSRRTVATAADGIGWLRFVRGDLRGSLAAYRDGLEQAEELADVHAAALLSNMGVVEQAMGDFEAAEQSYVKAIALSERFRQEQFRCKAWLHYGELACDKKQYDLALKRLATAADLASRCGFADLVLQISRARIEVYVDSERLRDAHAEFKASADARSVYQHKFELVRFARAEGILASLDGEIDQSRNILSRALAAAEAENFRAEVGLCRLALARNEASVSNSHTDNIRDHAQHAHAILDNCGHISRGEARQLLDRLD